MEFAEEFITSEKKEISELQMINIVRNYKKMYLPVELVGIRGVNQTSVYNDIKERSSIRQKWDFPPIKPPKGKKVTIQNNFKAWIKQQRIYIAFDFYDYETPIMVISHDFQYLKIQNKIQDKTYNQIVDRIGRTKYNENEIPDRIEFMPIIGNLSKNRIL